MEKTHPATVLAMAHAAAQAVRVHPLNPPRIVAASAQKVVALPSVAKILAVATGVAIMTLAAAAIEVATGVEAMRLAATARGIRRAWTAHVVPQAVAPCPAAHAAVAVHVVGVDAVVDAVN